MMPRHDKSARMPALHLLALVALACVLFLAVLTILAPLGIGAVEASIIGVVFVFGTAWFARRPRRPTP